MTRLAIFVFALFLSSAVLNAQVEAPKEVQDTTNEIVGNIKTRTGHPSNAAVITQDEKYLVVNDYYFLQIIDAETGDLVRKVQTPLEIYGIDLLGNDSTIMVQDRFGISFYSFIDLIQIGKTINRFSDKTFGTFLEVKISPNKKHLLASVIKNEEKGSSSGIVIYNLETKKVEFETSYSGDNSFSSSHKFSPNSEFYSYFQYDHSNKKDKIIVRRITDNIIVSDAYSWYGDAWIPDSIGHVTDIAFSPDSKKLALCVTFPAGYIRTYDVESAKRLSELRTGNGILDKYLGVVNWQLNDYIVVGGGGSTKMSLIDTRINKISYTYSISTNIFAFFTKDIEYLYSSSVGLTKCNTIYKHTSIELPQFLGTSSIQVNQNKLVLNLQKAVLGLYNLQIMDLHCRMIFKTNMQLNSQDYTYEIDIENLPTGAYILSIDEQAYKFLVVD